MMYRERLWHVQFWMLRGLFLLGDSGFIDTSLGIAYNPLRRLPNYLRNGGSTHE